ncbi:hypothetical protein C8Q76DRAFT_200269 [Earliella scabrosa]|nr:hypothetical protein C8Q76DRAFT_200269 [Earliella scabrosa]
MVDFELGHDLPEIWDWEIDEDDWWKTSFRAISWAYKTKPDHPRPPHYHDHLARGRRRRVTVDAQSRSGAAERDVSLSAGLSGVRAAEDALKRYEVDAAIHPATPVLDQDEDPFPCSECSMEQYVWEEKVRELLGGILEDRPLPELDSLSADVPLWDLDNLESPVDGSSSSASSSSGSSGESDLPPSTPKPKTALSYAGAVSGGAITNSPTVLSPLPSKALSKAALPFIPATPARPSSREPTTPPLTSSSGSSDSPYSSPTYNFHFPSLNSASPADRNETRSLPISLQKDESGFYIEVSDDALPVATQSLGGTRSGTPRRPSTVLFPAFLTDGSPTSRSRSRKSTRDMVDEVRSNTVSGRRPKKANRRQQSSKDVDLASLISEASVKSEDSTDGWISTVVVSEDPSSRGTVADDDWIIQANAQASTPPPSKKHGHKRSSASGSTTHSTSAPSATFSPASSTMSLTVPHTPATVASQLPPMPHMYPPPALPYASFATPYANAPAAYMQMPYSHARAPWPMGYPAGMYPMYQPFGVMSAAVPYGMVPVAPLQPAAMFYDGKGKHGGGGALAQ